MPSTIAKAVSHLWRRCTPKPLAERVDLSGRNVIVTGASPRSIGYETARILAGWGAQVVATSLRKSGLESGDARVITVSSHLHERANNRNLFRDSDGYHSWDAYGLSKLALVHFSFEIERRFGKDYNLLSTAVHPGSVFTNITRSAIPEETVGVTLSRACSALASLVLFHPKHGAQTVVMCASKSPLQGGSCYEHCKIAEPSAECRQESVSRELWDRSADWIKTLAKPRSE